MYQPPDKPHAHGKGPCGGLEKCCFCPVWKPPRHPGSPAAVPSPRLPGTAGGSGRLSESDAWVTTSRWPPFNGQRRHLSSLPPSSFSLFIFFFLKREKKEKWGERKQLYEEQASNTCCCDSGWANTQPPTFRGLSSLPRSKFMRWNSCGPES